MVVTVIFIRSCGIFQCFGSHHGSDAYKCVLFGSKTLTRCILLFVRLRPEKCISGDRKRRKENSACGTLIETMTKLRTLLCVPALRNSNDSCCAKNTHITTRFCIVAPHSQSSAAAWAAPRPLFVPFPASNEVQRNLLIYYNFLRLFLLLFPPLVDLFLFIPKRHETGGMCEQLS